MGLAVIPRLLFVGGSAAVIALALTFTASRSPAPAAKITAPRDSGVVVLRKADRIIPLGPVESTKLEPPQTIIHQPPPSPPPPPPRDRIRIAQVETDICARHHMRKVRTGKHGWR